MAIRAAQQGSIDRLARVHLIREVFCRSPLFREAEVSEPLLGPAGEVALTVAFDQGPAVFQVVADSEEKAYAVLHALAGTMVDVERWYATVERMIDSEPEPAAVACGVKGRADGNEARRASDDRTPFFRGRD